MKRLMVAVTAAMVALGAFADTWIDPDTGYTWTYQINGDTAEIYNGGSCAISPSPTGSVTVPATLGGYPVTIIGVCAFADCSGLTSVAIPDSVTIIGDWAFEDCIGLTSVTIPDSLTSIGYGAFMGCSGLTTSVTSFETIDGVKWSYYPMWDDYANEPVSVVIGANPLKNVLNIPSALGNRPVRKIGAWAFCDNDIVTEIVFPDSVTSIEEGAFEDCTALTSVTIPATVTNIGNYAFCGNGLTTFSVAAGNANYSSVNGMLLTKDGKTLIRGVNGSVTIPDSVTEIGESAFDGCTALTSVTIPSGVKVIGESAFEDCTALMSVTIPSSVKVIGEEAFDGCTALTSVSFSEGLEVIGEDAFCGCENLGDVFIPSTVKEMDSGCFAFAHRMNSVFVADGNSYFKSIDGVVYSKDGASLVCFPSGRTGEWAVPGHVKEIVEFAFAGGSLSSLSIGAEVKTIGDGIVVDSFNLARIAVNAENPHFKDVGGVLFSKDGTRLLAYPSAKKDVSVYTVPATVTSVDQDAFGGSSLTGIILPSMLKSLRYETFVDSERLESIIVGAGLEIIGDNAFYFIPQLRTLTLPASLKTIEDWAFEECGNSETMIYVPEAAVADKDAYEDCPATIVKYSSAPLVKFNLNYDGAPNYPYDRNVVSGQPVGILMTPERDWYSFAGWYTMADGGAQVTAATVVTGDVTYYAQWTKNNDSAPVTPGYEVIDEKDIVAPYDAPKAVTLQGAAYDGDGAVVGIVELKLGKVSKGSGKVSGSFVGLDGKKHTVKASKLTGIDGASPVTVALDVKGLGTMNVTIGGEKFAGSLGGYHVQSADVGGNWSKGGTKVYVDATSASLPAGTLEDLLPAGESVVAAGGKWKFDKAASVKWAKPKKGAAQPEIYDEVSGKGLVVDTTKGKNLSGLKLTYTPKKGTFKGSFNVYALEGAGSATKLKKYKLSVSGVVVNGTGYGTAVSKNPAISWSVTVR